MDLIKFTSDNLYDAGKNFFEQLRVPLKTKTEQSISAKAILKDQFKDVPIFNSIKDTFYLGLIDNSIFLDTSSMFESEGLSLDESLNKVNERYEGIMVFAVKLENYYPNRSDIANLVRAFNKSSKKVPVIVLLSYHNNGNSYLTFSTTERTKYIQNWREGEKLGKVSMLKDINIRHPHTGHLKILQDLKLKSDVRSFEALYKQWKEVFDIQLLNKTFYAELSDWYNYALSIIKLSIKPSYYKSDNDNVKNFTIRLINRLIFSWFLKEKGLIDKSLLELYDYQNNKIGKLKDINSNNFLKSNSYYRGILQNIFFASINTPHKNRKNDRFFGIKYLTDDFNFDCFNKIPFLNGGLFDKLEEDNCNDIIDDSKFAAPNELFYGKNIIVYEGKKQKLVNGLNVIFSKYKFTIEENTPFEEDIALDPELLGLVFENLLAEADPDENVSKSARKQSGSFYTPRKVIDYMINESLVLYFNNYLKVNNANINNAKSKISNLVYFNSIDENDKTFSSLIIDAIDSMRVLDPACGSGAFPMGMLHRIVNILSIVDENNKIWVKKQLEKVAPELRESMKKEFDQHKLDYARKIGLIRNCIYGIDIQPMAVMITKLRFFISLLIEQKININSDDKNYKISPMPNIETKIICANSLRELQPNIFDEQLLVQLNSARIDYYNPEISIEEKESVSNNIAELLSALYPRFAEISTGIKYKDDESRKLHNKSLIKEWFKHSIITAPFFNMQAFFPEISNNGFDIVIGNPPYGGNNIDDDVKTYLGLGSKDPYGAFIARFLSNGERETPLKNNGVLSYIVSDTFMTIKSHKQLRTQMMKNYIYKIIRVHPDTFKATVNTAILITQRNTEKCKENDKSDKLILKVPDEHKCLMADMTNVSIHSNHDRFLEILYKTAGFEEHQNISSSEYAIYTYPQNLIATNSNLPFFVASPKLFVFMNDSENIKKEKVKIGEKDIFARVIEINNQKIKVAKLEQVAEVKVGLQTGDNDSYLYQNPNSRGKYTSIVDYKKYLLSEEDLSKIRTDEKLRLEVIEKGISRDNKKSNRYFDGKYIIPYDKGGESDADEGWLPNYYVPTNYFIDWSEWAVKRMKTLTTEQRNKEKGEKGGNNSIASRFQNSETYYKIGLTFSITGIYAPSFRLCSGGTWDVKGSFIESVIDRNILLGNLSCKFVKYLAKCFVYHTVDLQVDAVKEIPILINIKKEINIREKVNSLILNQQKNLAYDYVGNEQIEIDKLIYDSYGLNEEDIQEVENWYARRYPKLVEAQKRRAGKI
ncbi:hypothetical protein MASR1M45_28890 [Candidatus Kapaibacterium sp.]